MKRFLKVLLVLLVLLAAAAGVVWYDYTSYLETPIDMGGERQIVVEEGMSAAQVVDMLVAEGIVERPVYLRAWLWRTDVGQRIQPGLYTVADRTTPTALMEQLTEGGLSTHVTLTIHAGYNLYEIARLLHDQGVADAQAFLRRVTDPQYAAELGVPADTLEGYLLAGRYEFERGVGVDEIITSMHERFRDAWRQMRTEHADAFEALARDRELGDHELVTLASIVEREAVVDRERRVIARVFYNRFDKNMRLQSDPTCVYPPEFPGERPTPARCNDPDNAYSTYVITGLPPGPIGSPAAASLEAVLEPYDGEHADDYLYFVARNDGSWTHYFSSSYKEHQHGVDFFLRRASSEPPSRTRQP